MAVLCGDPGDETFWSDDVFFECGVQNDFDYRTEDFLFTCISTISIPANSDNAAYTVPQIDLWTDYRWPMYASDRCYSYKPGTTGGSSETSVSKKWADMRTAIKDKSSSKTIAGSSTSTSEAGAASHGTNPKSGTGNTQERSAAAAPAAMPAVMGAVIAIVLHVAMM
jgi:hypothetical protein